MRRAAARQDIGRASPSPAAESAAVARFHPATARHGSHLPAPGDRQMKRTLTALLLGAAALGACSDPTTFGSRGVEVRADAEGVEILNQRNRTIYYFAADRNTLALINWAACDQPAQCPGVAASERKRIPPSEIHGWGTSNEVIVYWWHLLPRTEGGFRVDSIRHIIATR
jgi:hypothetical protein